LRHAKLLGENLRGDEGEIGNKPSEVLLQCCLLRGVKIKFSLLIDHGASVIFGVCSMFRNQLEVYGRPHKSRILFGWTPGRCLSYILADSLLLLSIVCACAQGIDGRVETVSFFSRALGRTAPFSVVVPAQNPPPMGYAVLMILHGLGRNHLTLLENADTLALLKAQPFLTVLPDSQRGWWIDSSVSGLKYDTMLGEVIAEVEKRYPVGKSSARWGVAGWSMGGFGAVHFAERHPDQISFVASIIGLLDYPRTDGLPLGQRFPVDTHVFGDSPDEWNDQNPSLHLEPLAGKDLVIVVAEQAFDRTMNENFLDRARNAGLTPEVFRIQGEHVFSSVFGGLQLVLARAAAHFSCADAAGATKSR
jgi:S-formylglutathione hydrolase FrmB